jgi:hypothetical protein
VGRKHKTFPKSDHREDNETVKDLKAANRRLKSDNERLKAELATLEQAFAKTSKYLKDNTDNVSIEKIIEGVKKDKNLEQIKVEEACKKCGSKETKQLPAGRAGYIKICVICNERSMLKYDEEEKE